MHETLLAIVTYGMLAPWLLLALAPRWRAAQIALSSAVIPVLLSALYAWLYARGMTQPPAGPAPEGLMAGIAAGFTRPDVLLAAWVHFLVFDFMVGLWIVRDAQERGVMHLLVVPCLALTFFAGPVGLLAYLLLRTALRRGGLALCDPERLA